MRGTPTGSQPPHTWRKSALRRPTAIPCDCCETVHAFKRKHGMTPSQAYKCEHWPMLAAWEENRMGDYHRLSAQRAAIAKVLRDALACCVDCHYPLVATEQGFQFCPYERAGQHPKVKAVLRKAELMWSCRRNYRPDVDAWTTWALFRPTERIRRSPYRVHAIHTIIIIFLKILLALNLVSFDLIEALCK